MVYYSKTWNSPGQNTGVGSLSLLQGIVPTQGSNPGLLHCRWILHQLSHQGHSLIFMDHLKYHPSDPKETYQILVLVNSTASLLPVL